MITATEVEALWSVIGKVGAAIAFLVALVKGYKYLMSQMPTAKLEERLDKAEENLKKDLQHFEKLESRITGIEQRISETDDKINHIDDGVKQIGESQISLLRHLVNGNGQKEMEAEADKLTAYFIKRSDV